MDKIFKGVIMILGIAIVILLWLNLKKQPNKIGRYNHIEGGIIDTTNGDLYQFDDRGYKKYSKGSETFVKSLPD